ncbi:MAG: methyltransferase domain-containing protein [Bifidobacteriaceae bacterium]|jgi:SAM-dependent methyltransferase|nr:methyltransferase domain-containing protein [Bifidobacteriaceae bacterium]
MSAQSHVYTHGHDATVLAAHAGRTAANSAAYLLGSLGPGLDLIDVGCGAGTITRDFARLVAPGRVVGVDAEASVIATARAGGPAVPGLEFKVGDIYALGYPNAAFDVAHAHQVLQHLTDPVAALREMARVVRPGGVVAARDGDFGGAYWYPDSEAWAEWQRVYLEVARAGGNELAAGRRYLAWAHAAGFSDSQITLSGSAWTYPGFGSAAEIAASWAARLTGEHFVALAEQRGVASAKSLAAVAAGLVEWAQDPDACFVMPHVELLIRVA